MRKTSSPSLTVFAAVLSLWACKDSGGSADAGAPASKGTGITYSSSLDRVQLRDAARSVLNHHCGQCHLPRRSKEPAALAIYDLQQLEWAKKLTDKQLDMLSLMVTHFDRATADDRLVIKRFVEEEKKARAKR